MSSCAVSDQAGRLGFVGRHSRPLWSNGKACIFCKLLEAQGGIEPPKKGLQSFTFA
jgi:hypothetical protein